jgi:hypothetical protein
LYIPVLLQYLGYYIYINVCSSVKVALYLYKYLYKGPDTTCYTIDRSREEPPSEIDSFQISCYLSSSKGTWQILQYNTTTCTPSVAAIVLYLPNRQLGQI